MPSVYVFAHENPSRQPKALWLARQIMARGFAKGTHSLDSSWGHLHAGDVVVFADTYDAIARQVVGLPEGITALAMPSVLSAEQAQDAQKKGLKVLLTGTRTEDLSTYIENGTVIPIRYIPAEPVRGSLRLLQEHFPEIAQSIIAVFADGRPVSIVYPTGHYNTKNAGKEFLTPQDRQDMIEYIRDLTAPVIVVTGGRVDDDVVSQLRHSKLNALILSQKDTGDSAHNIDLMSAVIEEAEQTGCPISVHMDALAGNTWAAIDGSRAHITEKVSIFASNMLQSPVTRMSQAHEISVLHNAQSIVSWGAPLDDIMAYKSNDISPASVGYEITDVLNRLFGPINGMAFERPRAS